VVEVVTRGSCKRSLLTPTRDATIDKPAIPRNTHFRPKTQPLHRSRAEAFDQNVSARDEIENQGHPLCALEIDGNRAPPAVEHIEPSRSLCRRSALRYPI